MAEAGPKTNPPRVKRPAVQPRMTRRMVDSLSVLKVPLSPRGTGTAAELAQDADRIREGPTGKGRRRSTGERIRRNDVKDYSQLQRASSPATGQSGRNR